MKSRALPIFILSLAVIGPGPISAKVAGATADRKIFSDSRLGFEFQYPADYTVKSETRDPSPFNDSEKPLASLDFVLTGENGAVEIEAREFEGSSQVGAENVFLVEAETEGRLFALGWCGNGNERGVDCKRGCEVSNREDISNSNGLRGLKIQFVVHATCPEEDGTILLPYFVYDISTKASHRLIAIGNLTGAQIAIPAEDLSVIISSMRRIQ